MNMTANKLHCISNQIGLDLLNLTFVHYKKNYENSIFKIWKNLNIPFRWFVYPGNDADKAGHSRW